MIFPLMGKNSLPDSKHQISAKKVQKESLWRELACFANLYIAHSFWVFFFLLVE